MKTLFKLQGQFPCFSKAVLRQPNFLICAGLSALALLTPNLSHATAIGFTDYYATAGGNSCTNLSTGGNWTAACLGSSTSPAWTGNVTYTTLSDTLTIKGPFRTTPVGSSRTFVFDIVAPASGTWSFSWSYSTADISSLADSAGYWLNGAPTQFVNNGTVVKNGSFTNLVVNQGDIFGFYVTSTSVNNNAGFLTITNFDAPVLATVAEPASLSLFAFGALALRNRRQRQSA